MTKLNALICFEISPNDRLPRHPHYIEGPQMTVHAHKISKIAPNYYTGTYMMTEIGFQYDDFGFWYDDWNGWYGTEILRNLSKFVLIRKLKSDFDMMTEFRFQFQTIRPSRQNRIQTVESDFALTDRPRMVGWPLWRQTKKMKKKNKNWKKFAPLWVDS